MFIIIFSLVLFFFFNSQITLEFSLKIIIIEKQYDLVYFFYINKYEKKKFKCAIELNYNNLFLSFHDEYSVYL